MLVFGRSHALVTSLADAGHRHCFVCVDILVTRFLLTRDVLSVCRHSSHKFD